MSFATQATNVSTTYKNEAQVRTKPQFVYVLELKDGRFAIGQAANACRRIASFNSGLTPGYPQALLVKRIVGIKERSEDRTIISTFKRFADQYGTDRVIAI